VTSILSVVAKPWLIGWAKKYTAEYAVDNFDKLEALLRANPDGYVDREGAVDWLKGASFRERDRAGDLGTLVHEAVEAYVLDKPMPKWSPLVAARMKGFEDFLNAYEPDYQFGMAEASVFNRSQKYAGTLDAIATIGNRSLVLDVKTGKDVFPENALQLAAYRHAEFIGGADGSEHPMPETDGAAVLHLPANGTFRLVEVRTDDEVFKTFLYIREVYRWQEIISKSVILGDVPWDNTLVPGTSNVSGVPAPPAPLTSRQTSMLEDKP
jgi:hypothetical protein